MANSKVSEAIRILQEKAIRRELNLVVLGRESQGKSTLVNNLLGITADHPDAANERDEDLIGTQYVSIHKSTRDGAKVKVFDTPGLYDSALVNQEKTLKQLAELTDGKIDLVLMCVACTSNISLKDHTSVMQLLTCAYGKPFWERTVFVLTFVDTIQKNREAHFHWLATVTKELRKALSEALQSIEFSKEEADQLACNVKCLTAGKKSGKLPYENEDWDKRLFLHCLKRMDPAGIPTLFQARYGDKVWKFVFSAVTGGGAGAVTGAGIGAIVGLFGGPFTVPFGVAMGAAIGGGLGTLCGVGFAYSRQPSQEEMEIIKRELHNAAEQN